MYPGGNLILSSKTAARIRDAGCPVLVLGPGSHETVFKFDRETANIGSHQNADFFVEGPAGSQPWALLQKSGSALEIFDLQNVGLSLEGGEFVQAAEIPNGGQFLLGEHQFLYLDLTADILPAGLQLIAGAPTGFTPPIQFKHPETDFNQILVDRLKQSPWLLISFALHALIFAIGLLFGEPARDDRTPASLVADFSEDANENFDDNFEDEVSEEPELSADEVNPETPDVEVDPSELLAEVSDAPDVSDEFSEPNELVAGLDGAFSANGGGGGLAGSAFKVGEDAQLNRNVGALKLSGLDIVFLIDATASMDQEIYAAKRRISSLISLLEALQIQFRIGVVAFRDKKDEYVTRIAPLTGTLFKSVAFLDEIEAEGGDDIPEAVFDAVLAGTRMRWSRKAKRVMVLVGDAPPKTGTLEPTLRLLDAFQSQGGVCHSLFSETRSDDFYGARSAFQAIARQGNGSALDLADESQIVEDITMLALGIEDRRTVRRLVRSLEGGVRTKVLRRILARSDLKFVVGRLRKKKKQPELALELTRLNSRGEDRDYLLAYFELLRDSKVSTSNHWLVTVLLRRLLIYAAQDPTLDHRQRHQISLALKSAKLLNPDASHSKNVRILKGISKRLYDAKFLKLDD